MRRKALALVVGVMFVLSGSLTMAAVSYELIDLGPGIAYAINDSGQVVGQSENQAVLFDPTGNGKNVYLGGWIASDINNSGEIVGCAGSHAVLFDLTDKEKNIDLGATGGDWSHAYGINNSGEIVGDIGANTEISGVYNIVATLFDSSGGGANINLTPDIADFGRAYASGINDDGKIVGSKFDEPTLFDRTGGGDNISLGKGCLGSAFEINNNGKIVGFIPWGLWDEREAVLFDPSGNGANITLGTLGGDNSEALSINDLDQIVGWAETAEGKWHAALFDPTGNGVNIDLNNLINEPDWVLEIAYDINNNGWIIGQMVNSEDEEHVFLLTPEPATLGLLTLGGLLLIFRRKSWERVK